MKISVAAKAIFTVLLVLLIDQTVKIWIKTHMDYREAYQVIDGKFYIYFIENPGMAFGWEFGGLKGKMILSIFRIAAVFGIGWYLSTLIKNRAKFGLIFSFSLILAGAIGNIIDCAFYGLIFDKGLTYDPTIKEWISYSGVASIGSPGYAGFLKGVVVDMLYFPLIKGHYPQWFPFMGGREFEFFRPVFNIADSSITIGVFIILLFQRKFFKNDKDKKQETPANSQIDGQPASTEA